MNRTERLAEIEQMLFRSAMGLRAVEIADACGVDRRTIYRDLSLLADVGVPIHQKDARFFIDREHYTAPTRLTFDEAMALFLACRVAARLGEPHDPHRAGALGKLALALPTPIARHLETIVGGEGSSAADARYLAVLETMTRAWGERRKVKIWYAGAGEGKAKARDFAPYFVEPDASGVLCAVGFDSLTQRVLAIRLKHIRRAWLTSSLYQVPPQFDARAYLTEGWARLALDATAPETVVLRFTPEAAALLPERPCPAAQTLEIIEERSVRLSLSVIDWNATLPWIRSWGSDAEVLEPETLRRQFAQDAARAHARYLSEAPNLTP